MKNLPIGIQNLSEIAETNSIYVDKTQLIHQLTTTEDHDRYWHQFQ